METEIMSQLPGQYPGPVERGPELPAPPPVHDELHQPSQLPPPPPYAYGPGQPAQRYGQPPQARRGILGWLLALGVFILGYAKYAFLLIKGVPALLTLSSLFVSFGLYAWFRGPSFAAALVIMILVHEMGHVVEIQRQGLKATAPVFIPFLGAAIFQRSHPQDALRQAQIGIAGPLAGTAGATLAYVLYGYTHWEVLALAATLGFFLNLFNLIPIGMLDGGWILAPVSKWFQVFGMVLMVAAVFFLGFSPILFIIVLFSLPTILSRFRNAEDPYFKSVSQTGRWAIGAAWLALVVYLGFALVTSQEQLAPILRQYGY
jgi:Zn-dependent protease